MADNIAKKQIIVSQMTQTLANSTNIGKVVQIHRTGESTEKLVLTVDEARKLVSDLILVVH